jgi:hypothetical protein
MRHYVAPRGRNNDKYVLTHDMLCIKLEACSGDLKRCYVMSHDEPAQGLALIGEPRPTFEIVPRDVIAVTKFRLCFAPFPKFDGTSPKVKHA